MLCLPRRLLHLQRSALDAFALPPSSRENIDPQRRGNSPGRVPRAGTPLRDCLSQPQPAPLEGNGYILDEVNLRSAAPRRSVLMRCVLTALSAPILLATGLAADSPGAYDLLERTITTYRQIPSYSDHGEMVVTETAGQSVTTKRYQFWTAADGDGAYMFRMEGQSNGTRSHAVWRRDGALWLSINGNSRPSLSGASVFPLLLGADATPAFFVPILLLGDTELPVSPDAAALEGSQTCGTGTCDGGEALIRV